MQRRSLLRTLFGLPLLSLLPKTTEIISEKVVRCEESNNIKIIESVSRIETNPCEYAKQIRWILDNDPRLTMHGLAAKLGKSFTWLLDRLSLCKLIPEIQEQVDVGEIRLSNAYALAKVESYFQPFFVQRAKTMSPIEFHTIVRKHQKTQGQSYVFTGAYGKSPS